MIMEKNGQGEHLPGRRATILAVDDDANNLAVLHDCLTGFDYTVLVAEDGESALARAEYARPDLILLDIMMPGMDGFETCRRLKRQEGTRDIPVIFMSALGETGHKVRGLEAGAVDYVVKPFQQEELLARVGVHLSNRELTRRLRQANELLEERVRARTADLARANSDLERKVAELLATQEALRESEGRFRAIFDQTFQQTGLLTPRGIVLAANRTALEFCGARESQVLGRFFWECPWWTHSAEQRERVRLAVRRAAAGELVRFEALYRTPEGDTFNIDFSLKPLMDDGGKVVMLIPEGRDITSYRRLEEQLRQSQKMEAIGTLAGGVAHDFNNILTVIIGFGSLLRESLGEMDEESGYVDEILDASHKATKLVQSLLAFSRKQVMEPRPEELNGTVRAIETLLRRIIGEDIELSCSCAPGELMIMADCIQIEQVLMNLAVNARDAMPEGGLLAIATEAVELAGEPHEPPLKAGPYARISVADTGCGIPEENQRKIFEPFFTTKEVGKGTGLGLSIVYGIVKQHGGEIVVESGVGRGTRFSVYLPLASACHDSHQAMPAVSRAGGTETILVAEDCDGVRNFMVSLLREHGYRVIAARDGADALEKYRANSDRIRLMLLDVVMPGMNGRQLLEHIRSEGGQARVIFTSGYARDIIQREEMAAMGATLLTKPVTTGLLLGRVREELDRP